MMVGRNVQLTVEKSPFNPGAEVLEVRDLVVLDDRGLVAVDGVSIDVRAGEVMALAGVQGNGQTEFVEALVGMRPVLSGTITLHGRDITNLTPRQALHAAPSPAGSATPPKPDNETGWSCRCRSPTIWCSTRLGEHPSRVTARVISPRSTTTPFAWCTTSTSAPPR